MRSRVHRIGPKHVEGRRKARHPESRGRSALLNGVRLGAIALLGALTAWGDEGQQQRVPVVAQPVKPRVFEDRLVLQGDVEARFSALVPARVSGTLTHLFVDEGDRVTAGETVLLQTDDANLKRALELARLDQAVADCSVRVKQAALDRETAHTGRCRRDYERLRRLFDKDAIGTLDRVEEAESEFRQAEASVRHAESLLALAREQERQAATAVKIAEKNLSDAAVKAPMDGVVSERFQDVGEMGTPAQPVFRIVDPARLEVSAFLPARTYAAITPGRTQATIHVADVALGGQTVSYKAPTIDPQLRVFEIKCKLVDPPAGVAPGAMARVTVVLHRTEGLAVPAASITQRRGRPVLFRIDGHAVREVPVETGLTTDGYTQVISAALEAGSRIVTMGQFLLNDGALVELRDLGGAPPQAEN